MDCVISCKLSLHTILKSYKFNSCKFISLKLLMEHSKTLKCKHACLIMIDFFHQGTCNKVELLCGKI